MRKISAPYTDPTPLFRHGGAPRVSPGPLLDFSASINPLGPPASVLRVLREQLPSIAHYPDPDCRALTERLASFHGLEPGHIVVGNGANDLIHAIARAFQPRRVAIAEPTYTEYLRASLAVGAQVEHWLAESDRAFVPECFDPDRADMVWLCNPNNPTGAGWGPGARTLVPWFATHPRTVFVVDEAFAELACWSGDPARSQSLIPECGRLQNVVVLRSLTKVFALPGLRLGYAAAPRDLAARVRQQVPTWSVNHLAQVAGLAALEDRAYRADTLRWLQEEVGGGNFATGFSQRLEPWAPHLHRFASQASFLLVRFRESATPVVRGLARRGLAVREASNFVGLDDRHVRIAIRTSADNARLFDALESVLAEEMPSCLARS